MQYSAALYAMVVLATACGDDGSSSADGSTGQQDATTTDAQPGDDGDGDGGSSGHVEPDLCPVGPPTTEEVEAVFAALDGPYPVQLETCSVGADVAPFSPGTTYQVNIGADLWIEYETDNIPIQSRWEGPLADITCDSGQTIITAGAPGSSRELVIADFTLASTTMDLSGVQPDPFLCTFAGL